MWMVGREVRKCEDKNSLYVGSTDCSISNIWLLSCCPTTTTTTTTSVALETNINILSNSSLSCMICAQKSYVFAFEQNKENW